MTKPKTLEQLRADKERAETQLAQEQHKLERLENRKKYLEQGVQAAISTETERSRSPAGPRRLGTATHMSASLSRGSLRSLGVPPTKPQKRQNLPF